MQLDQKNVLLGICGGIAAYKTPDLVRKLTAHGANVRVVLTDSASHFVSALSLQAVSGNKVSAQLLDEEAEAGMGHIELARWADYFVVAPATANTIAKLCYGLADDLLSTLALATTAPLFIAPAMNQQMWAAPATTENMQTLKNRGAIVLGPAAGEQACGDVGYGRMLEPDDIADALADYAQTKALTPILNGLNIMITAGPTREAIDPVRYISNHSSGKMGFALAKAAQLLGAKVTLVAGPVSLPTPQNVVRHNVESAQEMLEVVHNDIAEQHIFIACAAVADYKLDNISEQKMKKQGDNLQLCLSQNPDILKSVAFLDKPPFTVGFAAETQDVESYAKSKLEKKKLNMIAANDVSNSDLGFNSDRNALIVLSKDSVISLEPKSKYLLALELLKLVKTEFNNR
ncbi:bifunctional phosphopantothenoylcysteine decarboxylase/phosphopantothenate--cysteine ligase CoaBC [Glaciecola petra]|uniref:Coenzyme A biosynthesis bifunctional protein CoaBC n=1 Tax=Glaciecola petra TaxID=3075602 RepID=A0ABU2ZUV5_9ALTE|nr:bifunctional phosphopantothenoylcysteine decarboxylase/phosphopantothenate--cysteine ligase CoaBC [Aestuariibacter sp. P117]MDT0596428.1 bifunctional phosphopantothenoylcysteine decarboxylase/phosphopantothenate--cysteine ligase CoaBC [Aestuariibacter sp. P117]